MSDRMQPRDRQHHMATAPASSTHVTVERRAHMHGHTRTDEGQEGCRPVEELHFGLVACLGCLVLGCVCGLEGLSEL